MGFYQGDAPSITTGPAGVNGPSEFTWDSGGFEIPGLYEEIIDKSPQVYPKLKHWYTAEFSGSLGGLNWLVKTIDRPKIDIEHVEQIRYNVKRIYPVKYNFGDLSITFWDDINHTTILTLNDYFQSEIWEHDNPKTHGGPTGAKGNFLMRDDILIEEFKIIEHSIQDKQNLEYTFYNSLLSSIDMDSEDDEGDESVYTVQLVLKIEGYAIKRL